jgi:hypothetical protein
MDTKLINGHGTPHPLKIDENGRAFSNAVSTLLIQQASIEGVAFNVNTGKLVLSGAGTHGLIYLKNTGEKDLLINSIGFLFGTSTAGEYEIFTIQNATTGTLITGASAIAINKNKNGGSTNTINALIYKGASGTTITDGEDWYYSLLGGPNQYTIMTGDIVLRKGTSIAIKMTTPGAANVSVFLAIHEHPLPIK